MTIRIGDSILSTSAPIFSDISNRDLSNLTEQGQAKFDEKANKNFNNVVEIAEGSLVDNELKTKLNKQQITNCLLEVPQRIKLELNDGTLTLKAGSEIIVPNGFEADGVTPKFDYVTVETDATGLGWVGANIQQYVCFYNTEWNNLDGAAQNYSNSSTSFPATPTNGDRCYRTDLNELYTYRTSSGAWEKEDGLPIGLISSSGTAGKIGSIDQVFNGIGCIGGIVWVDKGVKGLAVNGKNKDSTYKSKEVVFDSISISPNLTVATYSTPYYVYMHTNNIVRFAGKASHFEQNEKPIISGTYASWYSPTENVLRFTNNGGTTWAVADGFILVADIVAANNTITEFKSRETFRAVNYSDKPEISGWGMPSDKHIDLTLGASGSTYTAPANGWFTVRKVSTGIQVIYFFNTANGLASSCYSSTSGQYLDAIMPVVKGQSVICEYTTGGATQYFRFVYAEGEV